MAEDITVTCIVEGG